MQRYEKFRCLPNLIAKKHAKKHAHNFDGSKVVIWSFVKIEIRHPKFRHNIININIYYIVSNDRVSKTKMTK